MELNHLSTVLIQKPKITEFLKIPLHHCSGSDFFLVHAIHDHFAIIRTETFRRTGIVSRFAFAVANCDQCVGIHSESDHFADNTICAAL
jgi:hypothetical protein